VTGALSVVFAAAQTPTQTPGPTLRSESQLVLVPTLVMSKSGQIVYGLSAKDFIIEDNGVEQQTHLDEAPNAERISVVVAVQRGGSASLELEEPGKQSEKDDVGGPRRKPRKAALSGLGTMVEGFIGESRSEVAVVTFDSKVELLQDFAEDVPATAAKLEGIKGSDDDGAAILDAVSYSIDLLEHRPKDRTRVLLLISELRDHGSKAKLAQVVKRVTLSNTLIYSFAFSPLRAETVRDLKGQHPDATFQIDDPDPTDPPGPPVFTVDLLGMMYLASNALRKNSARAVAELTGGEYSSFKDKRTFDDRLAALTSHVRDRYFLSFAPKNPQEGLHAITVRLRVPRRDVTVLARNRYWAATADSQ
jgi:VWFA-related protein